MRRRAERNDSPSGEPARLSSPASVRATRLALWALVTIGAVGGTIAAVRPAATVAAPHVETVRPTPAGVAGVAEIAVRRWLTGDEADPSLPGIAAKRPTVLTATTVAARDLGEDSWAVTVAAELLDADHSPLVWHVEVGVARRDSGLAAVGTPAVVPPPASADATTGGPALRRPAPDDPLAATAEAFLDALLTGSGDPARYLAPGTHLAPVVGSGLRDLRVERTAVVVDAADTTVLRAEALATTAGGVEVRMVYELTLTERDGRWEVRAVSGAPTPRSSATAAADRTSTTTSPPTSPPAAGPASSPGA